MKLKIFLIVLAFLLMATEYMMLGWLLLLVTLFFYRTNSIK